MDKSTYSMSVKKVTSTSCIQLDVNKYNLYGKYLKFIKNMNEISLHLKYNNIISTIDSNSEKSCPKND